MEAAVDIFKNLGVVAEDNSWNPMVLHPEGWEKLPDDRRQLRVSPTNSLFRKHFSVR